MRRLLVASVILLLACPGKYEGPGSEPAIPGAVVGAKKIIDRGRRPSSAVMECDRPLLFTVTIRETGINCTGYNYRNIFDEANALADAVVKTLPKCPARCAPLHVYTRRLVRACNGGTAQVVREVAALCPLEMEKPAGAAEPPAGPITGEDDSSVPIPPGYPPIAEEFRKDRNPAPVTCRPIELVTFEYREPVRDCSALNFDFRSYVEFAKKRAEAVCATVTCAAPPPPCAKLVPPKTRASVYRCLPPNNKDVEVVVEVQCCG